MLKSILLATRPKTLVAAVVPVSVGASIAHYYAPLLFNTQNALLALGICLCLQIATNFFNDAIDYLKGADDGARIGPKRMAASGNLSVRLLMLLGGGFLVASAALAWPLFLQFGWPVLLLGVFSLYLCYGYTGGPYPLAYRGLGEAFVILFFGIIAVSVSCWVSVGSFIPASFGVGMQIGCASALLILINNIRDQKQDKLAGKRTLVVRMGDFRARKLAVALLACVYLLAFTSSHRLELPLHWSWIISGLLALVLAWRLRNTKQLAHFNRLLALSALHLLLIGGIWCWQLWANTHPKAVKQLPKLQLQVLPQNPQTPAEPNTAP